jgi:hypothetical protein
VKTLIKPVLTSLFLLISSPVLALSQSQIVMKVQEQVTKGNCVVFKDNTRAATRPVFCPSNPGYVERYIESTDDWERVGLMSFSSNWAGNRDLILYSEVLYPYPSRIASDKYSSVNGAIGMQVYIPGNDPMSGRFIEF